MTEPLKDLTAEELAIIKTAAESTALIMGAKNAPSAAYTLRAVAQLQRLQREVATAMGVLKPNMPESGLVDACRQVKQAAISEADNSAMAEAELQRLTARTCGNCRMWKRHRASGKDQGICYALIRQFSANESCSRFKPLHEDK